MQKNIQTPKPSAHLFLIQDNQILLTRRKNTGYGDGKYTVPAGHVQANETFTHALVREAADELGIKIPSKRLKIAHAMHRKEKEERVDVFLTTDIWEGEPKNLEPKKFDDVRWFPINALPHNMIPYIRKSITDFRKNITYSEFGWR